MLFNVLYRGLDQKDLLLEGANPVVSCIVEVVRPHLFSSRWSSYWGVLAEIVYFVRSSRVAARPRARRRHGRESQLVDVVCLPFSMVFWLSHGGLSLTQAWYRIRRGFGGWSTNF